MIAQEATSGFSSLSCKGVSLLLLYFYCQYGKKALVKCQNTFEWLWILFILIEGAEIIVALPQATKSWIARILRDKRRISSLDVVIA